MLFVRMVWCALLTALIVGSVQFGVEQWRAVPIIRAAEVFESQKMQAGSSKPSGEASGIAHAHDASGAAAEEEIPHRAAWTWVANVLHGFSMALLMFAVMGWWIWRRGGAAATARLALAVACAGFLSLDLWPSLGLPAEIPGMDAAALQARQAWWLLAAGSAAMACAATAGIGTGQMASRWRCVVAVLLMALPFIVGAPQLATDPLAGFSDQARAQLQGLEREFIWSTHWISLSFWVSLACVGGWVFGHWIRSVIPAADRLQLQHCK